MPSRESSTVTGWKALNESGSSSYTSLIRPCSPRHFESGAVPVLDGVLVVADGGSENSPIAFVAPVSGWRRLVVGFPGVALLVTTEELPPRFRVFADDLLGDTTAEDALALAFEIAGVGIPDALSSRNAWRRA